MDLEPSLFIFRRGSASYFRAQEILGAVKKGQLPGGNDNDGSGVPAFKILALPYMTNAANAYWFGLDERYKNAKYGFQYLESQPISLDPVHVVYRTKEIQWTVQHLYAWGHNDSRPWIISEGDNS